MKKLLHLLLISTALFIWTSCASLNAPPVSKLPPKSADEVSFVSFNVENLFDTTHDEGKDDYTYLPLAAKQTLEHKQRCAKMSNPFYRSECLTLDWNEDLLKIKMQNIAEVVLGIDGQGPDMMIVLEVENLNVLSRLNKEYLAKAGYQTVTVIPSADKRGITVGFLSRFPLVGKPVLHPIPFKPKEEKDKDYAKETRGILEVTVKLPNGDPLTIFGAHFPSQASPHEWREQASQFMSELMAKKGPKAMTIAAGDLNITAEEESEFGIFKNILSQQGMVSHFVGCKECPGSHNYRKAWSFLDAHVYGKALSPENGEGSYALEPETIDVIRYNQVHLYRNRYPKRFDMEKKEGVSDHFPLYARLKKRAAKN